MPNKLGLEKTQAADKANKEKKAELLKKQVADLSTFTKRDSQKWTSKPIRQRTQVTCDPGIVGLKTLGSGTKITRTRAYRKKRTE